MSTIEIEEKPYEYYNQLITLIGQSGSGKSTFLRKLTPGNTFQEKSEPSKVLDAKILELEINNEKFQIDIIDTPGKKEHEHTLNQCMIESDAIIFFYDIRSSKDIFNYLENSIKKIKEKRKENEVKKEPIYFLLGTFADLEKERKIQIETFKEFCQKNSINFVAEISLKTIQEEQLKTLIKGMVSIYVRNFFKGTEEKENKIEDKNSSCPCCIIS